mgnify:CR=1 FL=1
MKIVFLILCLAVALAVVTGLTGTAARAEGHDTVILTVTGLEPPRTFTRADLEAIGVESFETSTIWTDGIQEFSGTPLHAFVAALGLEQGVLNAIAINDYRVEIPVSDAVENGPILAFARNGVSMSLRDNGPLWVVYPYDSNIDYRSEVIYSRSIWQLERIDVVQ